MLALNHAMQARRNWPYWPLTACRGDFFGCRAARRGRKESLPRADAPVDRLVKSVAHEVAPAAEATAHRVDSCVFVAVRKEMPESVGAWYGAVVVYA